MTRERDMTINERVRQVRKKAGYTIKGFSDTLHVPAQTISKNERGERSVSSSYISKLAETLHIDANWLLTGEGETPSGFSGESKEPDTATGLHSRVKDVLDLQKKSNEDLAAILGVNKNTISAYRNRKGVLVGKVLEGLVTQFNVNADWLLTGKGDSSSSLVDIKDVENALLMISEHLEKEDMHVPIAKIAKIAMIVLPHIANRKIAEQMVMSTVELVR